ncbi:hypothetical protein GmHk_08G023144 [Glycine max]|nr:hypothetical protein GmHk_08G023144 [Glycine max]
MSGQYKCRNKEFVRRNTGTRKCGCPFKLRGKPVRGGEGWMVKLICGIHNHELAKTLVGRPYAGRLTKDEKNIIEDMTKSMVKPRNILLTLKEHNTNSCTMIKQIYNARNAYHSTYKTNRYKLPLLDTVGVTPTGMTFSVAFAYLEGELMNNIVWTLERFHIDKNVKAKCKSLIGQKNVWDYVMDSWGTLADCPSEQQLPECLQKFEMACSPWSMFVDYVCETWIIPHKKKFVTAWTNKVMHLGNTTTTRYALNEIAAELDRIQYCGNDLSSYGCSMRSMHGLPCACELSSYVVASIPLESVHMFWRRLHFSDQGLCEAEVSVDKWMDITDMGYVIASRYNVIVVSLSRQQSMTFFSLRSQPPPNSSVHRMICVDHVFGNHFVQVYLKDHCPLPPVALLWSSNCLLQAKQWRTAYIGRIQQYMNLMTIRREYVDLNED